MLFTSTSLSIAVSLLMGKERHEGFLLLQGRCMYQKDVGVYPEGQG